MLGWAKIEMKMPVKSDRLGSTISVRDTKSITCTFCVMRSMLFVKQKSHVRMRYPCSGHSSGGGTTKCCLGRTGYCLMK